MKNSSWRLSCAVLLTAMVWCGRVAPLVAADDAPPASGDRLEKMEQQINEMNQRQEQLLQRLDARPNGPRGDFGPRRESPPNSAPVPDQPSNPTAAKFWKDIAGMLRFCFLIGVVFNILLAVWIFSDIRKRGEGSGIFVALALLAGAPAAIIYSLVRLGDRKV
jgi:hypothetical protein